MKRIGYLSLALVTAVTIGCNNRNDADTGISGTDSAAVGTAGADNLSNADENFVKDIAIANMAEIELGQLAASHSTDPQVKKFAQMMIDDHTKAGESFKSVASQHHLTPPAQLDEKHRELRDKLAGLQGAEFDREYMAAMVDGHEDVADKLETRIDKTNLADWKARMADKLGRKTEDHGQLEAVVAETSDNPITMSLNQWAASTYPTVKAHQETAKVLNDSLKTTSKTLTH